MHGKSSKMAHKIGIPKITANAIKNRSKYCWKKLSANCDVNIFIPRTVGAYVGTRDGSTVGFVGVYDTDGNDVVVGCRDGLKAGDEGSVVGRLVIGGRFKGDRAGL